MTANYYTKMMIVEITVHVVRSSLDHVNYDSCDELVMCQDRNWGPSKGIPSLAT